jgi:hypothetical protein
MRARPDGGDLRAIVRIRTDVDSKRILVVDEGRQREHEVRRRDARRDVDERPERAWGDDGIDGRQQEGTLLAAARELLDHAEKAVHRRGRRLHDPPNRVPGRVSIDVIANGGRLLIDNDDRFGDVRLVERCEDSGDERPPANLNQALGRH